MKAVILTENNYPLGDAGAIRQHATAKMLEKIGYSVTVLGYGKSTDNKLLNFDGVDYISFRPKSNNKIIRVFFRTIVGKRMIKNLKKYHMDTDVVLLADVQPIIFKMVDKLYASRGTVLIHDSVEWFSPEQFKNGKKSLSYKNRDKINTKLITGRWRVMAISSYLENHFLSICQTERIPVIMDVSNIRCNLTLHENKERIVFSYVGSPGKKDYLKTILEGFELLQPELRKNATLNIVGVNQQQLVEVCGISPDTLETLKSNINIFGRLPHSDAIEIVRESDYTILIRDENLRYAKAGFPTKIVESLACGTPTICNFSSDLSMYLVDGENSIIASGHSAFDVKNALERAIDTTREVMDKMRFNARYTAENCFDYHNYITQLSKLTMP